MHPHWLVRNFICPEADPQVSDPQKRTIPKHCLNEVSARQWECSFSMTDDLTPPDREGESCSDPGELPAVIATVLMVIRVFILTFVS